MRFRRPLRALQVEPTSCCTRNCRLCPRAELGGRWIHGHLDTTTWARLRPDLELAQHVHLQGWGEPLLHPDLPQMVRDAKGAGCRVGLTTNGDLLETHASWIAAERVDRVAVSVAGAADNHARDRDGSDIQAAWKSLSALKRHRRRGRPILQVSYLLTADNAADLPEVVVAAADAGAEELFVIHLDVAPSTDLAQRRAFTDHGLRGDLVRDFLDQAAGIARRRRVGFRGPARQPEALLACALDPTNFAFVTWQGRVAPCVNLGMPVNGPFPRCSEDECHAIASVFWGDLHTQSLGEILDGPQATAFRAPFVARKHAERRFRAAQRGWGGEGLRRLERTARRRDLELEQAPFPPECRGCPKADGW